MLKQVAGIIVHSTGVSGQSAGTVRDYFDALKNQSKLFASAHYVVDKGGQIIQCIPETEIAYHAGADSYSKAVYEYLPSAPNYCTIGIEMCEDDGIITTEVQSTTQELIKQLIKKYKIPLDAVLRHYDVTGKECPKHFVWDDHAWILFLEGCEPSVWD
ncbi:MAG: peptidoglycan recognition family protein [Spirochaetales bacterium]